MTKGRSLPPNAADNYYLRIRRNGQTTTIESGNDGVDFTIILSHTCSETTGKELFEHELRWSRTVRSIAGAGHAGSVVTHVMPLALLGALLLAFSHPAVATLAAAVTARLMQKRQVDRLLGRRGPSSWLLPGRDMLSFAVFLSSFLTKQVDWRGLRYQVKPSGVLTRS